MPSPRGRWAGLPSLTQFVNNQPSKITMYFPVTVFNLHMWQFGGYIQDDYRITPQLTFNLGFRYDHFTVVQEASGRVFNRGVDPTLGPGFGAYRPANQMYNADYHTGFQPRLGLAYSPWGPKTVIRSGFGIMTTRHTIYGGPIEVSPSSPTAPANLNLTQSQIATAGLTYPIPLTLTNADLAALQKSGAIGTSFAGTSIDAHFNNPYAMEWNLAVEQALPGRMVLDLGYVGDHGLNENFTWIDNEPNRATGLLPQPLWGTFNRYIAGDNSNYNAMELKLRKLLQWGLTAGANYTWAKNLSDAQGDAPTTFQGETRYGLADLNRFDISANRGNVVGTRRQRLLVTGTYELPFGKGRQWLNSSPVVGGILGGWNLNTITVLQTGPYLTPTDSVTNDQTNTDPEADGSIVRPDRVGNPIPAHRSAGNYFNFNAFAHTPLNAGRIGNAGVGTLEAPGTIAVSAGLAKVIAVRESWRLRFESTFTNVLNRTNYAPPPTNISNQTSFGVLTAAQTAENAGNRTGQIALRFEF